MVVVIFATAGARATDAAAQAPPGATRARAEVQIGLCAPADHIVQALGLRARGSPIEVWQFDDATLTLFARGVRLRLRVASDGRSVFTLKVAAQDCARLDRDRVPAGEGKCEYDVYATSTTGAMSLNVDLGEKQTSDLVAGRMTPAQALSPAQAGYLRDIVAIWPLPPGLRALGPIEVRTYRDKSRKYDIDISQLRGGEKYAEISRKVPLADADREMKIMEGNLSRAGVDLCSDQSSQASNKLRALLR